MFNFLKKKKDEEEDEDGSDEGEESEDGESSKEVEKSEEVSSSGAGVAKLSVDLEKVKASVEAFAEVRKSFTERFNRITEQIGELRAMILDRDKSIQDIELKAIKSYDLVATVQPEKIGTEIQKQGAKIEALKANMEGNESIMDRVMDELKETKRKIDFFRGVEEVVKLSEETKKELIDIKKVESKIHLHTDKVETIYSEMRKKFQVVEVVDSQLQELKAQGEQNERDVQVVKEKSVEFATKEDVEKLSKKIQEYIDVLGNLEKKSSMSKDIDRLKDVLESLK